MKTLKELPKQRRALWSAGIEHSTDEPGVYMDSYDEDVLKDSIIKDIKAFNNGEYHTDFAADDKKGQENIVEYLLKKFNITKEELL